MLRKKLGHSIEEDLSQERKIFTKKRDQDLNALRTKVEVMENEITTLKTRNYELKKQLTAAQEFKHSSPIKEPSKAPEEIIQPPPQHQVEIVEKSLDDDWREKYEIILHENTELRRGLQEILDSLYRLGGMQHFRPSNYFLIYFLHFLLQKTIAAMFESRVRFLKIC